MTEFTPKQGGGFYQYFITRDKVDDIVTAWRQPLHRKSQTKPPASRRLNQKEGAIYSMQLAYC